MEQIHPKPLYMQKADLYDRILSDFPYVADSFKAMVKIVKDYVLEKEGVEILEFGFGTGLLTEQIAQIKEVQTLIGVDPSKDFYSKAKKRLRKHPQVKLLKKDATSYKHPHPVDIIAASFTYHHIPDVQKLKFLKSVARNLKKKGIFILGDEFIPPFKNKIEKIKAIKKFYSHFIKYLISQNTKQETLNVFHESLAESLRGVEEYKTSLEVLKKQLQRLNLRIKRIIPIYPAKNTLMGCKVIVISKPPPRSPSLALKA